MQFGGLSENSGTTESSKKQIDFVHQENFVDLIMDHENNTNRQKMDLNVIG